jgi:hypothetical protein
VQTKLRGARVVKAWSHVFAKFLTDPEVDDIQSFGVDRGRRQSC